MQVKGFFFVLTVLLGFLPSGFAQDLLPRPIVRLIYFLPNDRAPQPDIDEKIDRLIKDVQAFYAQHMENHGFDRKTFLFETDAQGKAIVHHVKGRFNHTYYQNNWREAWGESHEQFERGNGYINFTVLDVNLEGIAPSGRGGGNGRSGTAFVTTQRFKVWVIAHELGHAFGLGHDYRPVGGNWKRVLGISDPTTTSFCAAEWLDAIPAFNAPQTPLNQRTTIEMLGPPTLVAAPNTFRFRFKVEDPDGLHQVQLHIRDPSVGHSGDSLLDYKGLKGVRSSTLEFVSSILLGPTTSHVVIESIDVHGYTQSDFYPVDLTPLFPPPEVVSIPDANLAAAVRGEIGSSITTHTLLNLRRLVVSNRGITRLTGLEHAHNLNFLELSSNDISDVSPLSGLTQLTSLELSGNNIPNISPLSGLTQLTSLELPGNNITDVTPLSELTQLTELLLSGNNITDVTPLSELTQLTELLLSGNNITDVTPLSELTQLTELLLSGNNITDVTPLSELTQLTELGLSGNNIADADVAPLSGLTQLTELLLSGNNITDVTPLSELTSLTDLWLNGNNITDVTPLSELTSLTGLGLSHNNIADADVAPLSGLTQLTRLWLNGNYIADVTPLSELTQLTELLLSDNNIADVAPLSGLTQLTRLWLSRNYITDVTPLSELTQLTELLLSGNNITDVAPLSELTQLRDLRLEINPLGYASIHTHIPAMQAKGIPVRFHNVVHPALLKVSGDAQTGSVGNPLAAFIVEAQDERGQPMLNVRVKFAVDAGDGTLNPTTTTTDADGKAQTILTPGWTPDTTTIRATATGIKAYVRFTATTTVLTDRRAEDVNANGIVDVEDLVLVASSFGVVPIPDALPDTDINDDGDINQKDVELVLAALKAAPAAPSLEAQWTAASLQRWIAEAKQRNIGDATFQRGIAVLEKLLTDLLPKQTLLLPNYPNPFNPETWIPYQLSEPGDVVVHIYGVNGVLVRTLGLGHQLAGTYQSRTRAAHWDGRNSLGETVASGIYFYTLSAGDFTATRKMLIRK